MVNNGCEQKSELRVDESAAASPAEGAQVDMAVAMVAPPVPPVGIADEPTHVDVPPCIIEIVDVPKHITETADKRVVVMAVNRQTHAVQQQKKAVEAVDKDVQAIRHEMKLKRAMDLDALAKTNRWKDKYPDAGDKLHIEWLDNHKPKAADAPPYGGKQ